jgi:hypothetical protein
MSVAGPPTRLGAPVLGRAAACRAAAPAAPRRRRAPPPPRAAIGFELPGEGRAAEKPERLAADLARSAASLLLYQDALRGAPGAAFLSALRHCAAGNETELLSAIGSLFAALTAERGASGAATSWADCILDRALAGAGSALARGAARGEDVSHLIPAAAHDLDVLQTLAVGDGLLGRWAQETGVGTATGEVWLAALEARAAPGGAAAAAPPAPPPALPDVAPAAVLAPLAPAERAALRADIAGRWRWGEAAGLLARYHAAHDYGLVAEHRVLRWTGAALQAQDVLLGIAPPAPPSLGRLAGFLEAWAAGDVAERAPPSFPFPALGRAEFFAAAARLAAGAGGTLDGVRAVQLPAAHAATLPELVWTLGQHPRTRFAILCAEPEAAAAAAALVVRDGVSWPPNCVAVCLEEEQA